MIKYFYILLLSFFAVRCSSNHINQCDYIGITKLLFKKIRANDKDTVMEMIFNGNKIVWQKGSSWERMQMYKSKNLVSDSMIDLLKYSLVLNKKYTKNYAVVTVKIKREGQISDILQVRFSYPGSSFGCKVQDFYYSDAGDSTSNYAPIKPILLPIIKKDSVSH